MRFYRARNQVEKALGRSDMRLQRHLPSDLEVETDCNHFEANSVEFQTSESLRALQNEVEQLHKMDLERTRPVAVNFRVLCASYNKRKRCDCIQGK